jgi:hypothetical protein
LNGSTSEIVDGVARHLNQLSPDYETARRIVSSNVGLFGPDAVRDGYAEMMADVADNRVKVPSVKAMVGYFRTAASRPKTERRSAVGASASQPTRMTVAEALRRKSEREQHERSG